MDEIINIPASISVDVKRFGIRIHRNCFKALGRPDYIQLLVNPEFMLVAIRAVDHPCANDSTHRIIDARLHSDKSYEIYSRSFIRKLCEIIPGLDEGFSYRIKGVANSRKRAAVFDLKTLEKTVLKENSK